jgi:hypothetical protein
MDDLLWGYLQQIMLNVDQMSCTISMMPASAIDELVLCVRGELTRFGRSFGAHSFPLEVEHLMRAKGINMLIRTPHRQQWYKSLLKTGVFVLWFRSEADKGKTAHTGIRLSLHISEKTRTLLAWADCKSRRN